MRAGSARNSIDMENTINAINKFFHESQYFYTISIDLDSKYSYVSPNYDRNFSSGKESLLGKKFSVTLHPEDIPICEAAGYSCIMNPEVLVPVTLRKHDGKGGYVTTHWEMQAMLNAESKPKGIFCIGYNISELVVTQDKLDHAETQLEEIGYIQSHVVRKPLANILGLTELLKEGHNKEILDLLLSSAKDLDKVVNEISDRTN